MTEPASLSGFQCWDEKEENAIPCDPNGKNVAAICPKCNLPMLFTIGTVARKGVDKDKPTTCPHCQTKCWLEVDGKAEKMILHLMP